MNREFVITDIHGCYKTFRYLVEEILQFNKNDTLFLLGDYINKGPSSKSTLDYIMNLQEEGFQVLALMGNHEKILLDAINQPSLFHPFLEKGGNTTLTDFGVDKISDIPPKYINFLQSLTYYIDHDPWILVHAGFNYQSQNPLDEKDTMLNIRHIKKPATLHKNRMIIHGHVPVPLHQIIHQFKFSDHWNYFLDAGCVYPDRNGMGFLVALELKTKKLFAKECMDDIN